MTVFAQCGSRKGGVTGAIVADALELGFITGAILSPAHEDPSSLDALIASCRAANDKAEVMIDPQLYVSVMSGARQTQLNTHGWFPNKTLKSASFTIRQTQRTVQAALDWQYKHKVTAIIAPSIPITSLESDIAAQIAYMMAEEACVYHGEKNKKTPLFISLIIREDALQRTEAVREFIDRFRALEPAPAGVYLIIERLNSGYSQQFEERALANLLWICHVLGNLDNMKIIFGYTDLVGILTQAAGATASACGWHQNLRYFHRQNWMPPSGGSTPRRRYTSTPLFDSLLMTPELAALEDFGFYQKIRSGTAFDEHCPQESAWLPTTSTHHHWASITERQNIIQSKKSLSTRLDEMDQQIVTATKLGQNLKDKGIIFERRDPAGHLKSWRDALRIHRDAIKL